LAKLKLSVPDVSLSAKSICTVFFVAGAVSGDTSCPIRCSDFPNTSFVSSGSMSRSRPTEVSMPVMPVPHEAVSTNRSIGLLPRIV